MIGRRYRLRSAVGRGGMGTVWLAEDELLGRAVAVKEVHLPPGLPEREREELRHRLLREARVAARLDHPSAVTVYDVVEEDGWPYIVMEFVRASTLAEVIRDESPLPPARVAAIGLDVLGALEAAHAAGIVHRDVKPANIMIRDDGRVTLTDFGIATSSGESSLTSTGLLLGSPSYIAPERARGQAPGPHSDLWSLGATLYTAVEGHAPFERGEPFLTLAAVTSEDHAPFDRAGPLAEVIEGLLARKPADRLDALAARGMLRAVAGAAPSAPASDATPPGPAEDVAPAPREPGARTTALAWSAVIAAAESDAAPPAAPPPDVDAPPVTAAPPVAAAGERPAPVLVPVPGREASAAPVEASPTPAAPRAAPGPGDAAERGPRRAWRGLGLVLGLVVFLLAGFGVNRYLQGGTAAGDAEVGGTSTPAASAPATTPATEDPQALAPDPTAGSEGDDQEAGQASTVEAPTADGGESAEATQDAPAPSPEQPSQGAPAAGETAVPANFATYTSDEYGWTVRHPPGWEPVRRGNTITDLREPGTGRYLRVDTTDTPGPSALGDWQEYEPSFMASHPNYQQIRMENVDYRGYDAADWEYTYTSGGATLHAVNRGFVLADRSAAFALNFQTREGDWASSREIFDQMAASFQP